MQGIAGESKSALHPGASDLDAFRFGGDRVDATKPPRLRVLVLGKAYDKASPMLFSRLVSGASIPKAEVAFDQVSAAQATFLKYRFDNLRVVDYEHQARVRSNAEKICLTYDRVEIEYKPTLSNGTLGQAVKAQYPPAA
jgi:type VI protein secretion system component Hcp